MKKCLKFLSILIIALVFSTSVFAAEANKDDVTLSVVSREECSITFDTYGLFEKKLLNIDEKNKTIDITLTVKNTYEGETTHEETEESSEVGEVVFLIDNSTSMETDEYIGNTAMDRFEVVIRAAKQLANKLFTLNSDIKIGIATFSSSPNSTEVGYEGSDADARTVLTLNNNQETVIQTLESEFTSFENGNHGNDTDLEVGVKTAAQMFSTDTTKAKSLVILTDGVPNLATGFEYDYSPAITQATINKLIETKNSGINILSVLCDSDFYVDGNPVDVGQYSTYTSPKTMPEIAQDIFGTSSNPKIGPVFYAEGDGITDAISELIYKELRSTKTITVDDLEKYTLTDVVIKDYFPQNIVDNFNFEKLSEPQIGTVSDTIDTTDRSITWNIPKLEPKQASSFTYRLSLKDKFNSEIIDLTLPTNEKVVINYKIDGDPGDPVETRKTPSVKLKLIPEDPPKEDPPDDPKKPDDPTVAPDPIPKTGSYTWIAIGLSTAFGLSVAIYGAIKSYLVTK